MRIIGESDVQALIGPDVAIDLARRTLRDQAIGDSMLSTPSSMTLDTSRFGGGRFKFKAAAVGHMRTSGIRLISRLSPTDPDACNFTALYSHRGVGLSGLVAELWISRIRTAAFGVATMEALVYPGRQVVVALFGTGKIAHELIPMLERTLDVCEVRVNSRREDSMATFVARHGPRVPFAMRAVPDRREMVDGADIVITVTDSSTPLVFPGTVKPGAVICSMGGRNELDYGVLLECRRLIVDDIDFASEVGDGGAWIAQGHLTRSQFAERVDALACEVVAGCKPARTHADDRVLAIVQGMATGDVAFAAYALQQAERLDKGTVVELPS